MADTLLLDPFVPGKPEPQGSATAFVPERNGRPIRRAGGSIVVNVTHDNAKLKGWRAVLERDLEEAWQGHSLIDDEDLAVECDFYLKRPEGHWGTGRNAHLLKPGKPARPRTVPDVDKLLRAILDAGSEIIYSDDSCVTASPPEKHYAVPDGTEHQGQGVRIRVYRRAIQSSEDLPLKEQVRVVPRQAPADDVAQMALA